MSNFPSKRAAPMTYTRFTLDRSTPSLWRVTFNHPPINLIDSVMIGELGELFAEVERNQGPAVLVFDSADPDYFLAHYDITAANGSLVDSLPAGPTGFHPWLDIVVRLGKLPAVTISAIRGRARGAGSEFALATDIRFASRERAVLGQFEVGFGAVPGGGPASWLPRLVGRGRAFEILLGGEDFDGKLAERYGYVNRAIPDDEFEDFVDHFARRVSTFDRQALADIKLFVNKVSLPDDEEFPPQLDAFWEAAARPAMQARHAKAFEEGFQQRSAVELRLGEYVEQFADAAIRARSRRVGGGLVPRLDSPDQGGGNMKVIENYERAIENSDENLLREVFAPRVRVEIPAGGSIDPSSAASHVMSQVAKTVPGLKCVLRADAGNNWYFLGFEGQFEGKKLQAVDQVHLNEDGRIDQLIIYMRPIPVAQRFGEVVSQRLQPAR